VSLHIEGNLSEFVDDSLPYHTHSSGSRDGREEECWPLKSKRIMIASE
jgi:hypothetical protein